MMSLNLVPLSDITNRQYQNQWLIEDYMEKNSIGMLFGPPASAKSFVAMDIAFCVAAGIDWNGNYTEQGKVLYLAGEGFNGLQKRFLALEMKYKTSTNDVFFSDEPVALIDQESVDAVYRAAESMCSAPRLIVIDTLHRNFGAGDENSSRDFAQFLYNITKLMKALNSAILLVHHSGHSSQERARGSSSIKAALDVEYRISKKESLVTMRCTKAKEFDKPSLCAFEFVPLSVPMPHDPNGTTVTSAMLMSTANAAPTRTSSLKNLDLLILKSLEAAISNKGIPVPELLIAKHPELAGRNYVHLDHWRCLAYKLLDTESGGINKSQANQKAFLRSRKKLASTNKTGSNGDFFWIDTQ